MQQDGAHPIQFGCHLEFELVASGNLPKTANGKRPRRLVSGCHSIAVTALWEGSERRRGGAHRTCELNSCFDISGTNLNPGSLSNDGLFFRACEHVTKRPVTP